MEEKIGKIAAAIYVQDEKSIIINLRVCLVARSTSELLSLLSQAEFNMLS
jgi:hypothetical protein